MVSYGVKGNAETFILGLGAINEVSEASARRRLEATGLQAYSERAYPCDFICSNYKLISSADEYEYILSATTDPAIELLDMATDNEEEAVNAPLMRDRRASFAESQESDANPSSGFIWTLTLAAAISGLLFGYEYV